MKTTFKVFTLEERHVITEAWLGSDGLNKAEEMIVFRQHQGDFDSELEAIEFVKNFKGNADAEHGFEIVKTFGY
tara:strand:- start:241 stop:462 length:222 start_codon:yes stop_codon:yes gene_type:complete